MVAHEVESHQGADMNAAAIYHSILHGDADGATAAVSQALDRGADPQRILNEQMIAAMIEVGRLYEEQEYFIPEMMISARAMQQAVTILQPLLVDGGGTPLGRFVIGTVKGDLHDIGKNLVAVMLEGVGFEVVNLGTDVAPAAFVKAVGEHSPSILGMSALLTTTMPYLDATIRSIEKAGLRDDVAIMVGGAPVNQEYAIEIGADLFASDAAGAAKSARAFIQNA